MANRTHKSNQKLTQAEYRRHILDKARGRSGAASARADLLYGDQPWYKPDRSLGELYEQENSVKNWGNLDRTDRMAYREAELKEVRRLIGESVRKHPGAKGKDKDVVSNIIDAYVNGKDLPTDLSETERKDWEAILDDSAANAIEGTALPTRWRGTAQTGTMPESNGASSETVTATVSNGTQQTAGTAPKESNMLKPKKVPERKVVPLSEVDTVTSKYGRVGTNDTGVRVGGAPLDSGNTAARNALESSQAESLATDALQRRRAREDLQNDMKSDERRRYIERQQTEDSLDEAWKNRNERKRADREKAHKARMDKRYESRTLTGMSDWENLGRDAVNRNLGARAEGEDDESWNARSGAVGAVDKLRERFAKLGVKDADKNEFYAYNPNRMRDVSGLNGLFSKAVESGMLTDAQIEGLNKTLDSYEAEGRKNKGRINARVAMRDAENVRKYREMYGMGDKDVFSDEDVKKFHADRQAAERKAILKDMQVAPGQGEEDGRGQRISEFSDNWVKLMNTGFDPNATFKKAMADETSRKAFQEGVAGISLDDPERSDKVDQLRRRFIMNQAMEDAGLEDKTLRAQVNVTGLTEEQAADAATSAQAGLMSEDLPGTRGLRSDLQVAEDNVLNAETAARIAGISQGDIDAAKKRGAKAAATDVLKPREEDTRQAAKGGDALRPRRRAV